MTSFGDPPILEPLIFYVKFIFNIYPSTHSKNLIYLALTV